VENTMFTNFRETHTDGHTDGWTDGQLKNIISPPPNSDGGVK